jgi:membrane protein DedA with SNARE-associated domain
MSLELLSLENIQEIANQYGYWAVFLGIALENTGIPLPGETITVVGGFLAGSGELNYWIVLGSAIAGAVLGDNIGYWIGKLGGWAFLLRLATIFKIPQTQLEEARKQFSKNAPKAVFFGRFVAILRIFAGPMAGIVEMPYQEFLLCNFGGATVWAAITVTISFFLGRLIPLREVLAWMHKIGIIALILVVIVVIITVWLESRKKDLTPSAEPKLAPEE